MANVAGQDGSGASVRRDGDALVFSGKLSRDAVAGLWQQALPQLAGVRRLDVGGALRVDSAGLALLAELASRAGDVAVTGLPEGLDDLRAAYRLDDTLAFAR